METTAAVTTPVITDPKGVPQDFSKPITIRWDPKGTLDVTGWWLCVGTLDKEKGDWDILSGDMRKNTHLTIDVSDQPHVKGLRVQLLCSVKDNDLDPPERTMVLDPIVIQNKNFAPVFEAVSSIADEPKRKTGEDHPM